MTKDTELPLMGFGNCFHGHIQLLDFTIYKNPHLLIRPGIYYPSIELSGQWIASGSTDGSVRIWEVETGRCLKVWQFDEAVKCVAWNPLPDFPILAAGMGIDLVFLNTELGTDEEQQRIEELLQLDNLPELDEAAAAIAKWLPDEKYGGIKIRHFKVHFAKTRSCS
ncbi:hypothetical protein Bca52824_042630 [Brassica carinata]|uniref:Uncharacterized protein n=1 Tax=Brassica carinata TaxID=52824 RepID=A0A8X7RXM1_BRACI|nr:hypothetical protein Bca52824_042630 [Brassica carinata]